MGWYKTHSRYKKYYTETGNAVDDTFTTEGEPFEVKDQNEFTQKVEAIRDKTYS